MNDEDLLSLPADGDPGGAVQRPLSPHHPELLALSSEARLATALLMQAQALDGLHRAHADLLGHLDDAPDKAALQRALDELQQRMLAQLARERRRARRSRLLAAFVGLSLLAVGALALFSERQRLGTALADLRSSLDGARHGQRAEIEQAVSSAVERAGAGDAAALDEISRRLQAGDAQEQTQLGQLAAERDGLRTELAQARGELQSLRDAEGKWHQDLAAVRDERNRQIGENAQLRERVLDRERRLDELGETLAELGQTQSARAAAASPAIVKIVSGVGGGGGGLPARATAALRSSGVLDAQVMEAAGVDDGALRDVLVLRHGPDGTLPRMIQAASARVVADRGRAWLRLEQARRAGAPDSSAETEDIELPALDTDAWQAVGLQLPVGFTPLPRVQAALAALLQPHGYTVSELGSFDGERLGALVLRQEDENGVPLRTLRAGEAVLTPVGPELELRGGSITAGGDERAFFHGVYRLPLPGSDYGAWLAAVGQSAP